MEKIEIPATNRTPTVEFDFDSGRLKLIGESYPEDVTTFYNPLFQALKEWLSGDASSKCRFDFELIYFNSSSAKAIMMIMELLDSAAEKGKEIEVFWFHDPEDETMEELGEEFGEDLQHAKFTLKKLSDR
ncbi:DUF1987 domain-containing protein [Ruegeria arenilitoris]|uniref:DUF1987 domain-containing protein n=1 Tax=Ruegeria arenilitoris TaxID=1173585 RepID=UPI001C2B97A7|nr:DUF1987 domain-containing protein [Ruegeria arenilitoris]